jgi:uncharacterized phiE125 gp8 family phage protein
MYVRLISTSVEPVAIDDVRATCKIDDSVGVASLTPLMVAARELAEQETGRSVALSEWQLKLDAFPEGEICLPWPSIIDVDSVKYLDAAGVEQTLDPAKYVVDTHSEPGRIVLAPGQAWPVTQSLAVNTVTVAYSAGYATAAVVPQSIKQWIYLHVRHWFDNPEEPMKKIESTFADALLDRYRVYG